MKKMTRVLPLVALVALIAAIPASTQVVSDDEAAAETANLPLLIAVNRMELTQEQMVEIHSILEALLDGRETQGDALADLQEEMIAFQGTAEELDAILEAHRAEAMEAAGAQHEAFAEAIDQIKGILTLKQGEALSGVLGRLLGGAAGIDIEVRGRRGVTMRGRVMMPGMGVMNRILEEGDDTDDADSTAIVGRRIEMTEEMEARLDALRERMSSSSGISDRFGRMQAVTGRSSGGQGRYDLIQQLVDVLELKLQAIE